MLSRMHITWTTAKRAKQSETREHAILFANQNASFRIRNHIFDVTTHFQFSGKGNDGITN